MPPLRGLLLLRRVHFREDGYTNRGDHAPRNIFSLLDLL